MLIGWLAVLVVSTGAVVLGIGVAVMELAVRNYGGSIVGSLVSIAAVPFVLIGHNLVNLSTPLAVHASP